MSVSSPTYSLATLLRSEAPPRTTVNMGEMQLGKNDPSDIQYFHGRMYEFRLYYTAFDDHQVEMLTRVLE
jgi:hypothetical protein